MGQVTVTLSGDEARLLRALDRVVAKEREVGEAGREVGRKTADAHKEAASSLGTLVAGYGPWTIALAATKRALDEVFEAQRRVNQARNEAARTVQTDAENLKKLAQLSGGDPNRMRALTSEAREIAKAAGISTGAAAGQLFDLEKAGVRGPGRAAALADMSKLGLDPKALVAAAELQRGFGGSTSIDSLRGVVAGALKQAQPGQVEEFLESGARNAGKAKRLGISEQDLLAQLSAVSSVTGSAEKAGHELGEIFDKARPGSGLAGVLGHSDRRLLKDLGQGGFEAAKILQKGVGPGADLSDAGLLSRMVSAGSADGGVAAAQADAEARSANALSLEQQGIDRLGGRTKNTRAETASRRSGNFELKTQMDAMADETELEGGVGLGRGISLARMQNRAVGAGVQILVPLLERIVANTGRRGSNVDPGRDK